MWVIVSGAGCCACAVLAVPVMDASRKYFHLQKYKKWFYARAMGADGQLDVQAVRVRGMARPAALDKPTVTTKGISQTCGGGLFVAIRQSYRPPSPCLIC